MHWNKLREFIFMDGYGIYIWSSYALCISLLGIECLLLLKEYRINSKANT
mgnify:CR=1 FL=1